MGEVSFVDFPMLNPIEARGVNDLLIINDSKGTLVLFQIQCALEIGGLPVTMWERGRIYGFAACCLRETGKEIE